MNNFKYCFKWDKTLCFDNFYKNKARKDGLQTYCKLCMSKVNSKSFQDNKKNRTDYNLNYNKTDKAKQYRREWAKKNMIMNIEKNV